MNKQQSDFLFELYSEEIPTSYQVIAINEVKKKVIDFLQTSSLEYTTIEVSGTARRLYIYIKNLINKQPQKTKTLRGPNKNICFDSLNKPTPALLGFFKKNHLTLEDIKFIKENNQEYVQVNILTGGEPTISLLEKQLPSIFLNIHFPKKMKWSSFAMEYARPILQYFCIYKEQHILFNKNSHDFWETVPFATELYLSSTSLKKIQLPDKIDDYFIQLKNNHIIVHHEERLACIKNQIQEIEKKQNIEVRFSEKVLNEVLFLVEQPVVLIGAFSETFLKLPSKLIIEEMEKHQRYFPVYKKNFEQLLNQFVFVANTANSKAYANIVQGNVKVITSRLSDAQFFLEEDRKKPLVEYNESLKKLIFLENLGSMFDKKERLKQLVFLFLKYSSIKKNTHFNYELCCDLLKADLTTQLVYEFNNLQGYVGSIYAALDGHSKDICEVIEEHYLPRFQGDRFPKNVYGVLFSLIDKIDNIMAAFIMNKEPSSSQDPLAIRRQTLYCIEMLIQNNIDFFLKDFFKEAITLYKVKNSSEILNKLYTFWNIRLATIFEKRNVPKSLIQAALQTQENNIRTLYEKVKTIEELNKDGLLEPVLIAFKRMFNIVKNETFNFKKDIDTYTFSTQEEQALHNFAINLYTKDKNHYKDYFTYIANSGTIINQFFDKITILHKDTKIKEERLSLLKFTLIPIREVFALEYLNL